MTIAERTQERYLFWIPRIVAEYYGITLVTLCERTTTRLSYCKDLLIARAAVVQLIREYNSAYVLASQKTLNLSREKIYVLRHVENNDLPQIKINLHVRMQKEPHTLIDSLNLNYKWDHRKIKHLN